MYRFTGGKGATGDESIIFHLEFGQRIVRNRRNEKFVQIDANVCELSVE